MKVKSTIKATLGLLVILLSLGVVKAQGVAPNQLPYGEGSKAEWIKQHPDTYTQMGGQVTSKKSRPVPAVSAAGNAERPANDPNRVGNINPERPANDPNRVENIQPAPTALDRAPLTETQLNALSPARRADIQAHPERYNVKSSND